jgi:SPP1 gp7 family putative phage head morphogenesis protein
MAGKIRGRVSPLSKTQKLREARARRVGVYFAPGVHPPVEEENWYNAQLQAHVDGLHNAIEQTLFPLLRHDSDEIVNVDSKWFKNQDGFIDDLMRGLDKLRKQWSFADVTARALASQFVGKVDKKTQANIEKIVGNAMGVDLVKILRNEGIADVVDAGIAANVQLIKSIPSSYLDKVQMIITQEGTKGRTGKSLIAQIQEVYPVTQNKARFIARDQTAKLNGDISRQRQMAAGIRGYRWRTIGDNAVRESHKERNGKCYAWAPEFVGQTLEDGTVLLDPEKDDIGNPGDDYNCRCVAEPIIEIDRIIQ